jgi:four helix bundle protein
MQDHSKLRVYAAAQQLAREVYGLTPLLPITERYALADQLQRASVSVGSNIAEGCGRATSRDFCSYLDKALGSAREVEFQLSHAAGANLVPSARVAPPLATCLMVQRMLVSLIGRIRGA